MAESVAKSHLVSDRTRSVADIALEIEYPADAVPYAVGMGLAGGIRPQSWHWKWSEQPPRWKDQGSNLEFFSGSAAFIPDSTAV